MSEMSELVEQLKRIADALEMKDQRVTTEAPDAAQLQAMADANRDAAAEKYSDDLLFVVSAGRYMNVATGKLVNFTPYGWVDDDEA